MANINTSQIPLGYKIWEGNEQTGYYMSQPWAFWFQNFQENLPPSGSGFVINNTLDALGISFGTDADKGSPSQNELYFAYDTGITYLNVGGMWIDLIPEFGGDV